MTKEEAIKYLQQLYPNGGHCWLNEQRIEAIGMAVKALQEEPVSEELEEAADNALNNVLNTREIVNVRSCLEMFRFGAKWQKEQIEESLLSDVLPCFMHGGEADEVVAKLDEVLNQKK